MNLMPFMEAMGASNIPIIAAFFIGIMMAISPCPLATNLTAIAYISKKIDDSKHTIRVGFFYTFGRMFTYVTIASLIVFFGLNVQEISLPLQKYGEKIIGPFLIILGILMLDVVKLNSFSVSEKLNPLKEKLSEKGLLGGFLIGVVFALSFCLHTINKPTYEEWCSSLKTGDGLILPSVFAFATGLPVT